MGRIPKKALQGKHAASVLAKYKAYLDDPSIASQRHPVTNRTASKKVYLTPFGLALPANTYVVASATETVLTSYTASVNVGGARFRTTKAAGDFIINPEGYSAARVVIRTGRSATGTRETSKTSGLPYKYYGGRSVSLPFGRKDANEEQQQAFDTIKASILGASSGTPPLVTLTKEIIPGA